LGAKVNKNPPNGFGFGDGYLRELGDDAVFHVSGDVGKSEVTASVVVSELFVVKPKEMEHRSVEVMHVKSSAHRGVTHFIGCPVGVTRFSAPSG
jgi:ribosomal protein L23